MVTHEGFYDENLEFIRIGKGIQFACIMKPATTLGRHQLTTRFVSNFQVLHVDYGPVGILEKLSHLTPHASVMHLKLNLFWQCLQLHFKPDDHSHYLFCPRNLNAMADSLAHYAVNMSVPEEVAAALANEASKQFEDRIVD